jgi:uncharacterized SAM-binding protein YcdF (DUF218 family)
VIRRLLTLIGFLVVVIGFSPLAYWLAAKWSVPPQIAKADAIVVLGGGAGKDGLYLHSSARFLRGAQLFREGGAPLIFFTGGGIGDEGATEGEQFLKAWEEFGFPVTAARVDQKATSTRENALAAGQILAGSRVLLVTSNLHMRRARDTFVKTGFTVLPAPVPPRPERLQNPAARWSAAANLVYEWAAYLKYEYEGWVP